MYLAVFDLCGTLVTCNTLFSFARWACPASRKIFWADSAFVRLADSLKPERQLRRSIYLSELTQFDGEELDYLSRAFVQKKLPAHVRPESFEALETLQKAGWMTILVSSAPDFLVRQAARYFHCYDWRGSAYQNGTLTDDLTGGKERILKDFLPYDRLFVASDNRTDLNLLRMADDRMIFAGRHRRWWAARFPHDHLYD